VSGAWQAGRRWWSHEQPSTRQGESCHACIHIDIGISEGSAARVDANSERGTVRNSVPPQDNPGAVENKVTVHARTRHGDITIHRAGTPR
jgi:hypothetical protein